MNNFYLYTKNEVVFILHQLNEEKVKSFLALSRNKLREDFVLKCVDVARAFAFLNYNEQKILTHFFFYKDSPNYISWKCRMEKEQVFYLKRIGLQRIVNFLNGSN